MFCMAMANVFDSATMCMHKPGRSTKPGRLCGKHQRGPAFVFSHQLFADRLRPIVAVTTVCGTPTCCSCSTLIALFLCCAQCITVWKWVWTVRRGCDTCVDVCTPSACALESILTAITSQVASALGRGGHARPRTMAYVELTGQELSAGWFPGPV